MSLLASIGTNGFAVAALAPTILNQQESVAEDSRADEEKLEFLESKLRPIIPNHPFFISTEYDYYKTCIITKTPLSLKFLALKACARITKEQLKSIQIPKLGHGFLCSEEIRSKYLFAQKVLNASLQNKLLYTEKEYFGLFERNPSPVFSIPLATEIKFDPATSTQPPQATHQKEDVESPELPSTETDLEIRSRSINEFAIRILRKQTKHIIKLTVGQKIQFSNSRFSLTGKVTKWILRIPPNKDISAKEFASRKAGIWGYRGKGKWGLTGSATIEKGNPNIHPHTSTGTWGARNDGKWGLIGLGTIRIYSTYLFGETILSGVWGVRYDGKYDLTGTGTRESYDKSRNGEKKGKLVYIQTGTWGDVRINEETIEYVKKADIENFWDLINDGTITTFSDSGKIKYEDTGTWSFLGDDVRDLDGLGTRTEYYDNGKVKHLYTGTWSTYKNCDFDDRMFWGTVNKATYDEQGNIQNIDTAKWGWPTKREKGFTDEGTRTEFGPNGKVKYLSQGVWGDRGNGEWDLTQDATRAEFDDKGNITSIVRGKWGAQNDGKWDIIQLGEKQKLTPDMASKVVLHVTFGKKGKKKWCLTQNGELEVTEKDVKRTGKWSGTALSLDTRNFTQEGSEVTLGPNGMVTKKLTGIWGDAGDGNWYLTGLGTKVYYGPDGKITHAFIGTWGVPETGKWGLTEYGIEFQYGSDGNVTHSFSGVWGVQANGKWGINSLPAMPSTNVSTEPQKQRTDGHKFQRLT